MLTVSILYTPTNKDWKKELPNYICSDNKVHIRFKDYITSERISGFEAKLTYLLSYLINYSYIPTLLVKTDNKVISDSFLKTDSVDDICSSIKFFMQNDNFKGLKLLKNYKRQLRTCNYFGKLDPNCFPLNYSSDIPIAGSLNSFLINFGNISLDEYLFNDSIEIIIHEARIIKEDKFKRKEIRKNNKSKSVDSDFVELW